MNKIKLTLLFLCAFIMQPCFSEEDVSPNWTLELYGSIFETEDDDWDIYYGGNRRPEVGGSMAYRFLSVLDIGVSWNYSRDSGSARLLSTGQKSGSSTYHSYPLDIFAVLHLRFSERQWIVPYGGGGYTRFGYKQTTEGQENIRGSIDGYFWRAGIQFLLDPLDPSAAKTMFTNYGAINSYLIFDFKKSTAEVNDTDLGGIHYRTGILIEFQ